MINFLFHISCFYLIAGLVAGLYNGTDLAAGSVAIPGGPRFDGRWVGIILLVLGWPILFSTPADADPAE